MKRDVHIFWLHAWQLGSDYYVAVLGGYVYRRCPLGNPLQLAAPWPAGNVSQHLVKHPVDLALHIRKSPIWVQHSYLTPSSLAWLYSCRVANSQAAVISG